MVGQITPDISVSKKRVGGRAGRDLDLYYGCETYIDCVLASRVVDEGMPSGLGKLLCRQIASAWAASILLWIKRAVDSRISYLERALVTRQLSTLSSLLNKHFRLLSLHIRTLMCQAGRFS